MTIEGLRRGRPAVLEDLFERFGRDIHGVAFVILGDSMAAEDVLVDTLVSALEHGHSLREEAALRPWLLRIAVNKALGHRRRGARIVQLAILPDIPAPVDRDTEGRLVLWEGVRRLPPRMRATVALHYYADLSVDAVASALGISPNTVKSQLRLALEHLRRDLDVAPAMAQEVRHA